MSEQSTLLLKAPEVNLEDNIDNDQATNNIHDGESNNNPEEIVANEFSTVLLSEAQANRNFLLEIHHSFLRAQTEQLFQSERALQAERAVVLQLQDEQQAATLKLRGERQAATLQGEQQAATLKLRGERQAATLQGEQQAATLRLQGEQQDATLKLQGEQEAATTLKLSVSQLLAKPTAYQFDVTVTWAILTVSLAINAYFLARQ